LTDGPEAVILELMMNRRITAALITALALGGQTSAQADIVAPRPQPHQQPITKPNPKLPPPATGNRDAVALARRDPEIAKLIVQARGGQTDQTGPASANETTVQLPLAGQCGFAGCSTTTLVAFTFRSSGANTMTHTVLALVTCPPIPSATCTVSPAEVRAVGSSSNQR
jgi:hypothetical protein